MKVSIVGSGQVGRRVGRDLAEVGNGVIFYDINPDVLAALEVDGHRCSGDVSYAIKETDLSIVSVPTNLGGDGRYDYSHLTAAGRACGLAVKEKGKYHAIVLKSTVTPGTTEKIFIPAIKDGYQHHGEGEVGFGVAYNPEFLTVISDWIDDKHFEKTPKNEDRIVIGVDESDVKPAEVLKELYRPLNVPIYITNFETAEATKMIANSRLPLAISFMNQMSELLKLANERHGLKMDVHEAIQLASLDSRIGPYGSVTADILDAKGRKGGYGGPCFKKDPPALAKWIKDATGKSATLIKEAIGVNEEAVKNYGRRE